MYNPGKKYKPPLNERETDGRFGTITEGGEEVFPEISEPSSPATQWESKARNRDAFMDIGFIKKLIELLRR